MKTHTLTMTVALYFKRHKDKYKPDTMVTKAFIDNCISNAEATNPKTGDTPWLSKSEVDELRKILWVNVEVRDGVL